MSGAAGTARGGTATAQPCVLLVGHDAGTRAALAHVLRDGGYRVAFAATAAEALSRVRTTPPDLVISTLADASGAHLLRALGARDGDVPVVVTGQGTVDDAVATMRLGAFDVLPAPFAPTDVLHLAARALEGGARPGGDAPAAARPIVSRDPAMLRLLEIVDTIASSRAPVLLHGESGTGKELFARHLHERGVRRSRPFVAVSCAALPHALLESELFGHEPGAFPGALVRKLGKFELAQGGTLLLDDVDEMPIALQGKLLRVLQEYEVDRIGGVAPVPVDVRIVATTSRRLRDLVEAGRFRDDLFHRLHVVALVIPPLRERRGDVAPLADHFLRRFAPDGGRALDAAARRWLATRPWPGNVRELEHALERAVLLARGAVIGIADLEDPAGAAPHVPFGELAGLTVREMERRLIVETLARTRNNRTQAAKLLGISIRTLRNKLAEYRVRGELELARESDN